MIYQIKIKIETTLTKEQLIEQIYHNSIKNKNNTIFEMEFINE